MAFIYDTNFSSSIKTTSTQESPQNISRLKISQIKEILVSQKQKQITLKKDTELSQSILFNQIFLINFQNLIFQNNCLEQQKDFDFENPSEVISDPQIITFFKLEKIQININSLRIDSILNGLYPKLKVVTIIGIQIKEVFRLKTPNLIKISIDNNQIQSIKQFAKGFYPHLALISFQNNKLSSIPQLNTPVILNIKLQNNTISTLQLFQIGNYPSLQILTCYSNKLTLMPQFSPLSFPKIEQLNFKSNKIKSIEKFSNQNHSNLIYVNFQDNKITRLPLMNAQKIEDLILSKNQISQINQQYSQKEYKHLKKYDLRQNSLKSIPVLSFSILSKNIWNDLIELHLQNNKIDNVEGFSFANLRALKVICLEKNYINSLKSFKKVKMPSIKDVFINKNPIFDFSYLSASYLRENSQQNKNARQNKKYKSFFNSNKKYFKLHLSSDKNIQQEFSMKDDLSQNISFIFKLQTNVQTKFYLNIDGNDGMRNLKFYNRRAQIASMKKQKDTSQANSFYQGI